MSFVRPRAAARVVGVAACGAVAFASLKAGAQQPPGEVVRLEYEVPPACPSASSFFAQVQARVPGLHEATPGERARSLVVQVTRGKTMRGRLLVRGFEGADADREVSGGTCDEVISALALVASLALAGDTPETAPTAVLPPPTAPVPAAVSSAAQTSEAPAAAPVRHDAWHLAAAIGGAAEGGVAPVTLVTIAAFIEISRETSRVVAPSARAGFERGMSPTLSRPPGAARFTWTVAVLEGCPVRWRAGSFEVTPCLRVELGSLEGTGTNIAPNRSVATTWAAVGALGQAHYTVAGPVFVAVEVGLRTPLTRPRFFFQPDATIHRAPWLGALANASLGVTFL